MPLALQIEAPDTSAAALQQETAILVRLLSRQQGLRLERPPDAPIAAGERGAALELGKLLLSFGTPEGVGTLIDGLKLYVERRPEISVSLTSESGAKIEVTARNMSAERIVETAAQLRALLAPTP